MICNAPLVRSAIVAGTKRTVNIELPQCIRKSVADSTRTSPVRLVTNHLPI